MTAITIMIKTAGTHTRPLDLAALKGCLDDFIDTSEEFDAALGCPDQRSFTITTDEGEEG